MLEVSSPPSRAVPPKTGLSSLQREQALSISQEMRSSAKRAGGPLHASSVGRGLGPAPCLALPPGPHQLAASSGASLQRFGGGIQAGLPPALGTFKEAKLWGGKGRSLRGGQGGQGPASLPALPKPTLLKLPSEAFPEYPD